MKLIFRKNEKHEISVVSNDRGREAEFNYISMIKNIIVTKQLEDPEFDGDFSDSEKESVRSMIKDINQKADEFYLNEE